MKTNPSKIVRMFAPIERVDKENRTVTAYAYTKAEVGDGYDLTRAAMEAATDDYMRFANIREMHDKHKAAGVVEELVWDDRGCLVRVKVVDDAAWAKVDSGVYKGLSVGVQPLITRGRKVESCKWYETSLVDRPFDDGALILRGGGEAAPFSIDLEDEPETKIPTDYSGFAAMAVERLHKAEEAKAAIESDIAAKDAEITRLKAEVERLGAEPDPTQTPPTKGAGPTGATPDLDKARARMAEIQRTDWSTKSTEERSAAIMELNRLKALVG